MLDRMTHVKVAIERAFSTQQLVLLLCKVYELRRALLNQASTLLTLFGNVLGSACFALALIASTAGAAGFSPHRRDLLLALVLFFL